MISRSLGLVIAACLCASGGAAEARGKARMKAKRPVSITAPALLAPVDQVEQLRNWRVARWSLGEDQGYDDGSDPNAIHWKLRGAGVKMKMPLSVFN